MARVSRAWGRRRSRSPLSDNKGPAKRKTQEKAAPAVAPGTPWSTLEKLKTRDRSQEIAGVREGASEGPAPAPDESSDMTDYINARGRHRSAKVATVPTHKFEVGGYVSYNGGPGSGMYRVTRQLPEGGRGLQYRIRSDRDGQERVALESDLARTIL